MAQATMTKIVLQVTNKERLTEMVTKAAQSTATTSAIPLLSCMLLQFSKALQPLQQATAYRQSL